MKELCKSYEAHRFIHSRESLLETYLNMNIHSYCLYDRRDGSTFRHGFKVYGDSYSITFNTLTEARSYIKGEKT